MILRDKTIFVAGASGMVGRSVVSALADRGCSRILMPTSAVVDLTDQTATREFFRSASPDIVVLAAATAGGIGFQGEQPADVLQRNLLIQSNTIHAAHEAEVEKLVFIASACVYPRDASQPMREDKILTGALEPSVEAYAVAKIAGIKLCENYYRQYRRNFFSLTPPNLYGHNDKFGIDSGHVIPSLIDRFHRARVEGASEVTVWGTGEPRREFMHVSDLASAIVFALETLEADSIYSQRISHLNVGTGADFSIRDLAHMIREIVKFDGSIKFDESMPDGVPRKLLDVERIRGLGWNHTIELAQGLEETYSWYVTHSDSSDSRAARSR
ncbi:MAG TPA: GDP-L-fucose synthase [Pyrinomonadaceae bacterium]|nr:GDP-L-fucose synthase [Pyrinomonadaceae bacterium]